MNLYLLNWGINSPSDSSARCSAVVVSGGMDTIAPIRFYRANPA
jgi:hypothetical protein